MYVKRVAGAAFAAALGVSGLTVGAGFSSATPLKTDPACIHCGPVADDPPPGPGPGPGPGGPVVRADPVDLGPAARRGLDLVDLRPADPVDRPVVRVDLARVVPVGLAGPGGPGPGGPGGPGGSHEPNGPGPGGPRPGGPGGPVAGGPVGRTAPVVLGDRVDPVDRVVRWPEWPWWA